MIEVEAISAATTLVPSHAIVLYASKSQYGHSDTAHYATVHPMQVEKGIPRLGAGVAASTDGLMALFRGLDPQREERATLNPTRILTQGARWMVWYCPPSVRRLWFKSKEIGERSGEVPLPGLVFCVSPNGWQVFATKTGRRPAASTKLWQVPFLNVWRDGKICVGTAAVPTGGSKTNPAAWERSFFESQFTHPNVHGEPLVAYEGGAYAFWKDMLDGKFSAFPKEVLVSRPMTLARLLDDINRGMRNG